jgi:hypothetical protein
LDSFVWRQSEEEEIPLFTPDLDEENPDDALLGTSQSVSPCCVIPQGDVSEVCESCSGVPQESLMSDLE